MTHENRGRLTVNTDGNWRLYSNTIPANSIAIGTVTRAIGDTGALVKIEATGLYVQVNAGVVRSLNQRKVKSELGIEPVRGRPSVEEPARNRSIKLTDADWARFRAIGGTKWLRQYLSLRIKIRDFLAKNR